MKFSFLILTLAGSLLLISCQNRMIPLRNTYQETAYEFSSSSNKDQIWNTVIDLFVSKGLVIETMDKNDGLITTDKISFLNSYTLENKNGVLNDSTAFIVCNKYGGPLRIGVSGPTVITGQWILRIKENIGKTNVSIKLANPVARLRFTTGSGEGGYSESYYNMEAKSTGVFERLVEEAIK